MRDRCWQHRLCMVRSRRCGVAGQRVSILTCDAHSQSSVTPMACQPHATFVLLNCGDIEAIRATTCRFPYRHGSFLLNKQSAIAGWPGQLQDPTTLRALQHNLQQQLRQPSESPIHPSGGQFPTSSSLFNNPYAPPSSQPRHTHNLSQYGNPSHKPPPPDLRPPHIQQPHAAPSNPSSAPSQAPFGINALGSSLLNLNNPLSGLSALQPSGHGGHTDIAALMATPQSGQDMSSHQQFPPGFGQHAGGPSPTGQFSPSGQMPGFGGPAGGAQVSLRGNPGDIGMPGGAPGQADTHLSGPGGMAGMLAGSGGSGGAHDFRQQISTGYGAGPLGQHGGGGGTSAGIASLASLLGNFVPTDPRGGDGAQGTGLEITAAGQEPGGPGGRGGGGLGIEGLGTGARGMSPPPHACMNMVIYPHAMVVTAVHSAAG